MYHGATRNGRYTIPARAKHRLHVQVTKSVVFSNLPMFPGVLADDGPVVARELGR
ncbi:MAG: hypothetical protein H5T95_07250 [Firmicutes bacterium]|nr:hypothetical protein [Bacillota bacterium]